MTFTVGGRRGTGAGSSDANNDGVEDSIQFFTLLENIANQLQVNTQAIKQLTTQVTDLAGQITNLDSNTIEVVAGLEAGIAGLESGVAGLWLKLDSLENTQKNVTPAPALKVYGYTQSTPIDRLVVEHGESKDPISVLITDLEGNKKEINWKLEEKSIAFTPVAPTTFQVTLVFEI